MTRRLVGASVGLVAVMLVVLGFPFLRTAERYERARLRTDLERDAVVIAATVEDELSVTAGPHRVATTIARNYARQTGARVVIVDRSGEVLADSGLRSTTPVASARRSMSQRPEFRAALAGGVAAVTRHSNTLGYSSLFVAVPVSSSGEILGAVRVSFPMAVVDRSVAVQRTRLIAVGVTAASVVGLIGVVLARRLARPVADLREVTHRFGTGSLEARAATDRGTDDIKLLATEFNTMADRIDDLVSTQNAFVADASHELRSPLTAIRLQLEAMEYDEPAAREQRRERALDEVNRLSRNVDGLLLLARQQPGPETAHTADIASMLRARSAFWESLANERDVSIATDLPASLTVHALPDRVATVIDNLLANAIDAAPPDSAITVTARELSDLTEIHVIDEGSGMPREQRMSAFDRFWRASEGRSTLGGNGIGLAISRKLVSADHGSIRLDAAAGGGIDAVVTYRRAS